MKTEITVKDITTILESAIPAGLQEEWDNSGLLIGFEETQVHRILTCLELDMHVAEEAIRKSAEMIVTHHPLIIGSIRSIRHDDPQGALIINLIREEISVYSCHTPFDKVNGGNNDALAGLLKLKKITDLAGDSVPAADKMLASPSEMHIGRIGRLQTPLRLSQVIDFSCEALGLVPAQLKVVGNLDAEISKIGICTGAGAEYIEQAAAMGCQLFITGDLKYHQAQDAKAIGMCVIDAGHYGTEKIFPAVMKVQLEKLLPGSIDVIASEVDLDPFLVL